MLRLDNVSKSFTLHLQNHQRIPVIEGVTFDVNAGSCVVLGGQSGAGKSTIMKMVYGSYSVDSGHVYLRHNGDILDLATAPPRAVLTARKLTVGYVSQFLRVVPRVGALDVVAEPLIERGTPRADAIQQASELLEQLSIPERLWNLPPATFSGGEQQRVNIARGFIVHRPLLLLDEPTASLDARNRAVVIELIRERLTKGCAMLGIFHDQEVREAVATDVVDVAAFAASPSEILEELV